MDTTPSDRTASPAALLAAAGDLELLVSTAPPPSRQRGGGRHGVNLSGASPIVAELTRLGMLSRGSDDLARLSISPHRLAPDVGSWSLPFTRGETGRVSEFARVQEAGASLLTPQAVWAVAAFAVGQHYQAQIDERLGEIDRKLDDVLRAIAEDRHHDLVAATKGLRHAALRIADGVPAEQAVAQLSAQIQVVERAWSRASAWLAGAELELANLKSDQPLSARGLAHALPNMFGPSSGATLTSAREYLEAVRARSQLLILHMAEAADRAGDDWSESAFGGQLRIEATEIEDGLRRLQGLVADAARMDFRLDARAVDVKWLGDAQASRSLVLEACRRLLQFDDQLRQLRAPAMPGSQGSTFELTARLLPDGHAELEVAA
jgi:hypothetical protein